MHNTTHFTSFLSSNTSLCKTHTVCTYICMSKPALFYYLLWSDSTSGAAVLDLPLPLPLRLRAPSRRSAAPSRRSAAPVPAGRDTRQQRLEGVLLKRWTRSALLPSLFSARPLLREENSTRRRLADVYGLKEIDHSRCSEIHWLKLAKHCPSKEAVGLICFAKSIKFHN